MGGGLGVVVEGFLGWVIVRLIRVMRERYGVIIPLKRLRMGV